MKTKLTALIGGLLALTGCSSDKESSKQTDSNVTLPDAAAMASTKQFKELLAYDWTIDPGVETYWCVYQTLKEDLWVSDFRPLLPTGTHHVTVGFSDPGPPDGIVPYGGDIGGGATCTGVTLGTNLAFGGLVGTDEFSMPEGVAVKIPAGKQLLLSVHVFNTGTTVLSGHSGVEVVRAEPTKVKNEAEIIFLNNVGIQVTPGKSIQDGTATLDGDSTIFALLHHMHRTGVHMTTKTEPANGTATTLLEADYVFNEQKFVIVDPPVQLKQGDKVQVTCNYENPGTQTLTFGESTEKNEMCITAAFRYPAIATNFNLIVAP